MAMRKSRFTVEQIVHALRQLRQAETGTPVARCAGRWV
jgi:hypothetical protein